MRRPTVLLIAPHCYPPVGAEAIVTCKLVLALLKHHWSVKIITRLDSIQYYPQQEDDVFNPVKNCVQGVPAPAHPRAGSTTSRCFSSRSCRWSALLWSLRAYWLAQSLNKNLKPDVLISRATPLYGHLPALLLKYETGIPWIACWSDPLPHQKAPPPFGEGAEARVPLISASFFHRVVEKADWHIFPAERLRQYVGMYKHQILNKSGVIPHVALEKGQLETFGCSSRGPTFTLVHVGSLRQRSPNVLLKGFQLFLARTPGADPRKLCFVGPRDQILDEQISALGLERTIEVVGPKSYSAAQEIIKGASAALVIEAAAEESVFLPSKFVEYVQAGLPVIAITPKLSTISDLIATMGGGVTADPASPEEVAEAIATIYGEWKSGNLEHSFPDKNLAEYFSSERVVGEFQHLITSLKGELKL